MKYTTPLRCAVVSLVTSLFCLAIYHGITSQRQTHALAVVDIAEIYRLKESEFSAQIMRPGSTEAERKDAIDRARSFGTALSALAQSLPAECRCTVLNKAALVGTTEEVRDLTPDIKKRFGL